MNKIKTMRRVHRYFDDNIQPLINGILAAVFMALGFLFGHMS
ncbi:hypothetical protein IMAU80009_01884 [Lactiplantibacillus plantarum]|nr:hypothetical protein [Lactiplantibacillus plantarum]